MVGSNGGGGTGGDSNGNGSITQAHIRDIKPQGENENARLHNPRNIGQITDSIQSVGAARSIVIDENNDVLAGSGTTEAFAQAGLEKVLIVDTDGDTLVAVRRSGLSEWDKQRLAIADNRTGETSSWNLSVLEEVRANTPDILEGLFTGVELDTMLSGLTSGQPSQPIGSGGDEFDQDQQAPTRVHYGDIWAIGPHRIMCGDAGNSEHVLSLAKECGLASLLVTSPPYGVGKEYEGDTGVEEWLTTIKSVFAQSLLVCPTWFINLANRRTGNDGFEAHTFGMMLSAFDGLGIGLISLRMWAKDSPAWSSSTPYWRHTYKSVDDFEFLALFSPYDQKPPYMNRIGPDENNEWGYRGVWHFPSVPSNAAHPAAFPIELPTRAIRMLTDPNEWVYDPFLGSGTTLVAAHRLNRVCMGMEITPKYCDLALLRGEAEGIGPIKLIGNSIIGGNLDG